MTNRCLLGAWAALALALGGAQAHAQLWPTGAPGAWYIGPEGGWTKLTNQTDQVSPSHFTGPGGGVFSFPGTSPTANFNSGFNVGARGGYQWGPWRFEEEYSYRHSGLNTLTGGPFAISTNPSNVTGQRNSHAIMTNAIYDFTIGWPVDHSEAPRMPDTLFGVAKKTRQDGPRSAAVRRGVARMSHFVAFCVDFLTSDATAAKIVCHR